jgi:hypothetical protein
LHEISKRKVNWIGHILCRNCLLQWVIEGKIKGGIEVTGRRGRRRKKLLDDLKERRGYSHLKEEALDRTKWRAGFGRGFGPVVRQTTKLMNIYIYILYAHVYTCIYIYIYMYMYVIIDRQSRTVHGIYLVSSICKCPTCFYQCKLPFWRRTDNGGNNVSI